MRHAERGRSPSTGGGVACEERAEAVFVRSSSETGEKEVRRAVATGRPLALSPLTTCPAPSERTSRTLPFRDGLARRRRLAWRAATAPTKRTTKGRMANGSSGTRTTIDDTRRDTHLEEVVDGDVRRRADEHSLAARDGLPHGDAQFVRRCCDDDGCSRLVAPRPSHRPSGGRAFKKHSTKRATDAPAGPARRRRSSCPCRAARGSARRRACRARTWVERTCRVRIRSLDRPRSSNGHTASRERSTTAARRVSGHSGAFTMTTGVLRHPPRAPSVKPPRVSGHRAPSALRA